MDHRARHARQCWRVQASRWSARLATVREALKLRLNSPIYAAVLDVHLKHEMSFPVAEALVASATPFIFVSGFDATDLPAQFSPPSAADQAARGRAAAGRAARLRVNACGRAPGWRALGPLLRALHDSPRSPPTAAHGCAPGSLAPSFAGFALETRGVAADVRAAASRRMGCRAATAPQASRTSKRCRVGSRRARTISPLISSTARQASR